MSDFEDLRFIDLVEKFKAIVEEIYASRSLKNFKKAGAALQDIYNFQLTSQKRWEQIEEFLKSMFSSFNYSALIVNAALKSGTLSKEDNELLGESLEIMLKCCELIIDKLK